MTDMIAALPPATEKPHPPRRLWRGLGLASLILALLASTSLAAYLWLVSTQWTEQNDTLRTEATQLGTELAGSRADVAALEAQMTTLQEQLGTTSDRLSDLANEEAHAGDDLQYLGDLLTGYASCADSYDEVLTDALTHGYTYSNSNARSVQGDVAEYCDSLAAAYQEYMADAG